MPYSILLILVAVLSAVTGAYLFTKAARWHSGRRIKQRFQHGVSSEGKAEDILRDAGYEVIGLQHSLDLSVYVDGEELGYKVRPDAVAEKDGQAYLVEIKTGDYATNPLNRDTRRQLLEYYFSSSAGGVLLVNADAATVQMVRFDRVVPEPEVIVQQISHWRVAFALGVFVGAIGVFCMR